MDDELASLLERLPHRAPFRFLSRVRAFQPGRSGSGVWLVEGSEAFFAGHFPGRPVVPGVLIGEALAQLAGLVGFGSEGSGVRLAHIDLKLIEAVAPPAEITLRASVARELGDLKMFDVAADHLGRPIATGRLILSSEAAGKGTAHDAGGLA